MIWFPLVEKMEEEYGGIGGRDWRRRRGKELENLSSLRERQLLVKLGEDFQVERDDRVRAGYLQHRVDVLWGDEEKDIP
jgi:hypothetical protein